MVKSQEEALASGQVYDYCLLTTKCLPDIAPNHKLLAPALASKQIKSYALIQNGLDIEKDIYAALQENGQVEDVPIVTAAAWIGLMTSPDGKRIIWAGPRVRMSRHFTGFQANSSGRGIHCARSLSTSSAKHLDNSG